MLLILPFIPNATQIKKKLLLSQAKKKKVDVMDAADMGVDLTPKNEVLEVYEPPPRKEGIIVESVDELVDKLKDEAGVIQ